MSHAQIWDDTVLVDSWDAALAEYKHYHSIRACGENPQDVLDKHERSEKIESIASRKDPLIEDGLMAEQDSEKPSSEEEGAEKITTDDPVQPIQTPALPQHLVGSVQDEALKNLLMSWYYAGYYTGLYEGKQPGSSASQHH